MVGDVKFNWNTQTRLNSNWKKQQATPTQLYFSLIFVLSGKKPAIMCDDEIITYYIFFGRKGGIGMFKQRENDSRSC